LIESEDVFGAGNGAGTIFQQTEYATTLLARNVGRDHTNLPSQVESGSGCGKRARILGRFNNKKNGSERGNEAVTRRKMTLKRQGTGWMLRKEHTASFNQLPG
jgi:hypothetical protein